MAALENAIDLRFAVGDRVGNRELSDVFPSLLAMAESDLNSRLRTHMQIRTATLTFDEGEAPLPPDCLEMIEIVGLSTTRYQVGPFAVVIPCYKGDKTAQYYASIPSLNAGPTACNWVLARYPGAYIYGVALEAAKHLGDANRAMAMASLYGDEIQRIRVDDERARWPMAVVRPRGLTP